MNFSRFARYLLALLVSAGLAAPVAYGYDKDKGKGKAKHEDKNKEKDPSTGQKPPSTGEKHSSTGHKPPSTGGHDRDDDNDGNGGMRFRGMDSNGDGRITRREWRGNDNSFRNHDCNGNGVLSGEEVRPGGDCVNKPPSTGGDATIRDRTTRFRQLDLNGNGYLTLQEWGGGRGNFDALDRNNDGRLSLDEFVHRRS